jgi:predicted O-methyltransferase YrrM
VDIRYWGRALRSLGRHLPHQQFTKQWLTAGLAADAAPRALSAHFFDVYPEIEGCRVPMGDVEYRIFNMDPLEQYCLASITALLQPRTIFEIGTYDGTTTLLLARAAPEASIFTLDLPPDSRHDPDIDPHGAMDAAFAKVGGVGSRFRNAPESERITQLYGDSRTFDFSGYLGRMDMVLVDGAHVYEVARLDSENALLMLTPRGIAVWDDYAPHWPGVVQAVDEAGARHGKAIWRLIPTELAIYDPSKAPTATDNRGSS